MSPGWEPVSSGEARRTRGFAGVREPIDWMGDTDVAGETGHGGVADGLDLIDRRQRRTAPGRHHHWPDFLVRWLFGRGDEERAPARRRARSRGSRTSASAARPAPAASTIARLVGKRLGWKVYDEELIEAIAHRMEVPLDEVRTLDELAPSVVQDWLLPLREEYYAPAGGLSRPPGQADRGDRPRRRIDPGRPRGQLHAAARDDADRPDHRAAEGPRDPAGRADGRLGADGPPGRPRPRSPPAPVRSHHAPRQLERSPQLRHGARVAQPRPGDRRRAHRPRRRARPAARDAATGLPLRAGSAEPGTAKPERPLPLSELWVVRTAPSSPSEASTPSAPEKHEAEDRASGQ